MLAFASIVVACGTNNKQEANLQAQRDSLKMIKDSLRLDSFERASAALEEEKRQEAEKKEIAATAAAAALASRPKSTHTNSVHYVQSPSGGTATATPQAQKKGWSSAAKGAAIGAGAGAVTGVLVDKKDARGAIIGGLVGAGTGYAIGRANDRKTGRVQK